MAKLEITIDVADEGILGKIAKVEQEVLELEYTAVLELMRQLSDERQAAENEQNAHNTGR